ncbi:lymphocyte activation gene 3 protein isoform X6 [Notamacropus eugenii]|uniref:lymphocyte activation gene 3 protein isoform X6 n=1 Tax=Notamacropus eugenii TaxID=9315 RepID=UPI003B67E55C
MLWEVRSLVQLLLVLLVARASLSIAGTQVSRKEVQVVWAKEGFPVRLPCILSSTSQNLPTRPAFLWKVTVIWQRWQDRIPQARWHTVFRVGPGGLRSVRLPPQPRLQLGGLSLHQGDFSLWLRPAWLTDAGEYRARVHFEHGDLRCHLCLRFGQASVTASPPGPVVTSGLVLLNCSFDRPDLPKAVLWSRGRIPIIPSSQHFPVGNLLFLSHVTPSDAGPWDCCVIYPDGFNVSITHHLIVLVTAKSFGSSSSRKGLLCEVTPMLRQEYLLWTTLDNQTLENPPGPWLEVGDEELKVDQWQCQVYQGIQQRGAVVYNLGLQGTGAQLSGGNPKALNGGKQLPLFLSLGILLLLFSGVGAAVFRLRPIQLPRRFSALECAAQSSHGQNKAEEMEPENQCQG